METPKLTTLLLIAAIPAALVVALPTGHREDFNGCSTQQDEAKRKTCCDEVARDCNAVCDKLNGDAEIGPGAWIICGMDCDDAKDTCTGGSTIAERIDWPGQPALQIPGVFVDDNRIVTEEGVGLGVSTRSAVIEIQRGGTEREPSACRAVVATCDCPQEGLNYETAGRELRPVVTAGAVECRACATGESAQTCKPLDACAPVILSVQPCARAASDAREASGG
jgi:hypothetical protein